MRFTFFLYKFSTFNDGIGRYDSFPSIINPYYKSEVTWYHKDYDEFENCESISLNKDDYILNTYLNLKVLNTNISSCNIKDQTTIKLLDATEMPLNSDEAFNLVFLDPPYRRSLGELAIRSALASNWLSNNALIVLEEGEKKNYLEGFVLEDVRTYRDTILHFFRRVPN